MKDTSFLLTLVALVCNGWGRHTKPALLLVSAMVLFAGGAAVCGQSALDGFDPNANGIIRVVVVQPDGKILLGGDFTSLAPNGGVSVTRSNIARLNPDGTLDTAFNPNASGVVTAIAVQADGKILVGGVFTAIGGLTRTNIARLEATAGLADSFNPNANSIVYAIAVQADGKILAGGVFTSIGGQTRNRIARLNATTGLADSFDPNADNSVYAIVVQADGNILAGGAFTNIVGQTRNRIARLNATTGLADSFNPNANEHIESIAVQADGKILAVGAFTNIGGAPRNRIARLDPAAGMADSFNPNANSIVYAIAVQPDGKILAAGNFSSIGGQTRVGIARLAPTTGLADSFDSHSNGDLYTVALQPDGKILAGGEFTTFAPSGGAAVMRNRIARLETDGRLDRTLDLGISAFSGTPSVIATAVQPDGKILIGGNFNSVLGVSQNYIARLNTDGTLDLAFDPFPNDIVISIAVQADGKILVGGLFTHIGAGGGLDRNHIARLGAATGLADSWNPNSNTNVTSIALQPDGKILVAGLFTNIGGQTRNFIARLDATTGLADSFDPNADDRVLSIAVQADGKMLAGGEFDIIGGGAHFWVVRLDAATGASDASFDPIVTGGSSISVNCIALQPDGKILIGGDFLRIRGQVRFDIGRLKPANGFPDSFSPNADSTVESIVSQADGKVLASGIFTFIGAGIGGPHRNRIGRLDAVTGAADSFNPNANDEVSSIAVQADGKILAGGNFTAIGGQTRSFFARLSNDTPALQNLAATQNTITWTRGGSSPQLARVTFELSTDAVNYTALGSGTASGSDWTLTGLDLPTSQNLYIRARGSFSSGNRNDSESITESVRNVFLTQPPPRLNIQLSANTNVVLSWATNFTGFRLEANTNLTTNVWSTVSPAPAVSGTNNVVTNLVAGSQKFYRLRAP